MARYVLEGFGGLRPRVAARLLQDNEAVVASNVKLENGELAGWNAPSTATSLARPGTNISIWRMSTIDRWLHWTTDVDVAKSPVAGDTTERTYYTGDGAPKVTTNTLVDVGGNDQYPESSYPLAVANPQTRPSTSSISLSESGTVTAGLSSTQCAVNFQNTDFANTHKEIRNATAAQAITVSEFVAGFKCRVLAVNSANTFTIESNVGAGYLCQAGALANWTVTTSNAAVTGTLCLPNGITVSQTGHGLRIGDVLTITEVAVPLTCSVQRLELTSIPGGVISGVQLCTPENFATGNSETFTVAGEFSYTVTRETTDLETRSYVYTYVTNLGEESAPSPPSNPTTLFAGDDVNLTDLVNPPSDGRVYNQKFIYRTATGSNTTNFLFVGSVSATTTTFTDNKSAEELGEVITTEAFDNPPTNLKGLISFPGGILAGFFENVVCFSEPQYPHAWPTDYRLTTDYPVVGLGVYGNSILVVTEGMPYVITGVHPRSMSMRRIDVMQACVSKRSIQSVGNAVLYASPDGLVSASSSGFSIVTNGFLRKEDWEAYYPSTIIGAVHDNRYFGFYYTGTVRKCFIFDPSDPSRGLVDSTNSAYGTFYDPLTDKLYLSNGSSVLEWDGGAAQTYTWRSKELRSQYPLNLGAARVQASAYPITFTLIDADTGSTIATRSVTGREPFRLPSGKLYNRFYVEVSATSEKYVQRVTCSENLFELLDE